MFKWPAMPPPQGGGVPALPSSGVPFHLRVHPLSQNYEISMETHMGKGLVFRCSAMPPPQGPKHSTILGVTFYLCLHPLMQNYQI